MQSASLSDARVAARHRLLWRWHFYAGLIVMPLLLVLAITGTLYCFQPQIEPLLYHDRMIVDARAGPRLSEQVLLAKATAAFACWTTAAACATCACAAVALAIA